MPDERARERRAIRSAIFVETGIQLEEKPLAAVERYVSACRRKVDEAERKITALALALKAMQTDRNVLVAESLRTRRRLPSTGRMTMKIAIKTAHGYLSFQPPAKNGVVPPLEYRPGRGAWEEIELEGFADALAALLPNGGTHPVDPGVPAPPPTQRVYPFNIIPTPTGGYVAAIKAMLQQHGVNLNGACGAFAITKHVAYGLSLTNAKYGLLDKPSGNNCEGYATDVVMLSNGDGFDILGDGGNANNPQWVGTGVENGVVRFRPAIQP